MECQQTHWRPWEDKPAIQNRHKCKQCNTSFTRRDNLGRHIKQVHSDGIVSSRCTFCSKILSRPDAVKRHEVKFCKAKLQKYLLKKCIIS